MRSTNQRIVTSLAAVALFAGAIGFGGTGCSTVQRGVKVPPTADKVRTGKGEAFTYTADRTGTVYVWDADDQSLVYKGAVKPGQDVKVDPANQTVSVDGSPVSEGKVQKGSRYDVYFNN